MMIVASNSFTVSNVNDGIAGPKGDTGSILGENQWIGYKYSYPGSTRIYPSYDQIQGINPIATQIFDDSTRFTFSDDYYIAHFQTNLYVIIDKQITTTVAHDDDLTIYCNDEVVVSKNSTISTAYDITFNLKAGWNKIDILLHEIAGGDYVTFGTKLSSLVEHLSYIKGNDGIAGKDGIGIKTTVITYAISTSGTTAPTTGWTSSVPSLVKGQYLWTKTVWTYTDNSFETGYSVTYISKDGNNGNDGLAGKDGVGIKTTTITYAGSTSGTTAPTSGWTSTVPTVAAGSYLWTKTVWAYTDNTSETGYSVGKIGEKGTDGADGKDGVGIRSTIITYQLSSGGTSTPTGTWSTTVPTLTKGQYLWTRTTLVYTDNTTEDVYSVSYVAKDGNNGTDGIAGKDGVGIKSTTITYQSGTSGTVQPTGTWVSNLPSVTGGNYLWTRTIWSYTDGTSETGYSVAKAGEKGDKGDSGTDGLPGKDGVGIKSTAVTYQASTSGTTAPTGTWLTIPPTVAAGNFLWTRMIWTYTDGTTETGYSVGHIGADGSDGLPGKDGTDGVAGKDGVGIRSTTITYATSTSGTSAPTSGWVSTPPTAKAGQYVWTRTVWNYTDGTTEIGYSVGHIGTDGATGKDGIAGKDGVGIRSTTITYATSASGTSAPTSGWVSTPPAATAGQFVWTRTVWIYTDNTMETGYSVGKIGEKGATGSTGATGPTGPQGPQGPKGVDGSRTFTKSATAPDTTNLPVNAVWLQPANGSTPASAKTWDGTTWQDTPIESSLIAENIVGKNITGSTFANDTGTFSIDKDGNIKGSNISGSIFNSSFDNLSVPGYADALSGEATLANGQLNILGHFSDQSGAGAGRLFATSVTPSGWESYSTLADATPIDVASMNFGSLQLRQLISGNNTSGNAKYIQSDFKATDATTYERTVTLSATANFSSANIYYMRRGDQVTVTFRFTLILDTGWVGLSSIPVGYTPAHPIGIAVPSLSYRGENCTVYNNSDGWRLIPTTGQGHGSFQGSISYVTYDGYPTDDARTYVG